jgi:hypothetical protein
MNPGNSGGVLVNSQGNVMGIPMLTVVDPEFHTPAMALVSPSWSITSGQRYEMNRLCYHLERRISMKGLFYHRSATEEQVPQPMKEGVGATDPGPRNIALDRQNPDLLTPPRTDSGTVPNLKYSFSMAHNRRQEGGWAREVTMRELPISTTLDSIQGLEEGCEFLLLFDDPNFSANSTFAISDWFLHTPTDVDGNK